MPERAAMPRFIQAAAAAIAADDASSFRRRHERRYADAIAMSPLPPDFRRCCHTRYDAATLRCLMRAIISLLYAYFALPLPRHALIIFSYFAATIMP